MGDRRVIPISDTNHHTLACAVCGAAGFRPWKLGLMQCESCRGVFSPAIWTSRANEALEQEWFGEDYQPDRSFWVALFETWNNRKSLARLSRARPPGRRLLEIGVGSGSFLNAARQRGYEVMGCDLSAPICKRVRDAYGITMHGESLATLAGDNRFDVIVMNHVLEHVEHPVELLKDVLRLLGPGGVAHIAVPNVACWEAGLSGWTGFEPYHLTYFEPQTLERTVATSGLTIDSITTLDSFSGWFLAVLRTAMGVNRTGGAVTRPPTPMAQRTSGHSGVVKHAYRIAMVCVGGALWPLRWFQSRLGRGNEAVCIARNPQTASVQ